MTQAGGKIPPQCTATHASVTTGDGRQPALNRARQDSVEHRTARTRAAWIDLSLGFWILPNKNNTRFPLRIWTSDRSGIALSPSVRRTARSLSVAATLFLCGTGTLQNAVANGDTRTLTFTNPHTGEAGSFTFKKDGRYDPEVLKQLNWLARDWRKDEPIEMDPHLFDLLWEVYREVGATAPITLLCGYRSPSTNAMLRSRSKAVAETSQHMRGRAMDFYIPGVRLAELRETACGSSAAASASIRRRTSSIWTPAACACGRA